MNELLFFITIFIMFTAVVLINKFFGKSGVFCYIAFAIIIANIEFSCQVNMFGLPDNWVTIGNVSFASIFLATDIINEFYGYKESKKAVNIALVIIILFLVIIQIDLLFIPASNSFMHDTLRSYFGLDGVFIWVTISSVICFYLANLFDVWLFDKIRKKTGEKKMWIRNNLATIIANSLENLLLMLLGYYLFPLIFTGNSIIDLKTAFGMALGSSLIEIVIGILDTPFLYIAKKIRKDNQIEKTESE